MRFTKPRGTSDIFGDRMELWLAVERLLSDYLRRCGYREIRTPIFEMTDLFTRTVGEATDIVTKEMYSFKDRKGRSLTLRPENTAPVMRAYLENGLWRTGRLSRFYYIGPMFRYDRPQAGRYRQFHQVGAELIGSKSPLADAEIIDIAIGTYRELGFPELDVRLNSVGCPSCRPIFRKILREALHEREKDLCESCKARIVVNPMRVFDCKECVGIKTELPSIVGFLCKDCSDHFDNLKSLLEQLGIRFVLDPLLVRGLDYYTKTAFEIIHPSLGAQNALCGGGRYDGLSEDCGGPPIPAVGFSAGMERLLETIPENWAAKNVSSRLQVYAIVLDESQAAALMVLARSLRGMGISVAIDLSGRNLKKQLGDASSSGATFAVISGLSELGVGQVALKNLETGEQETVEISSCAERIGKKHGARQGF